MLGLMLGRLVGPTPGEPRLLGVTEEDGALLVRFDQPTNVQAGKLEGALRLQVRAAGTAADGQFRLGGQPLRWRIEEHEAQLWITLLSTRPLGGTWDTMQRGKEWQLRIRPQLQ